MHVCEKRVGTDINIVTSLKLGASGAVGQAEYGDAFTCYETVYRTLQFLLIVVIVAIKRRRHQTVAVKICFHLEEITGHQVANAQNTGAIGVIIKARRGIDAYGDRPRYELQRDRSRLGIDCPKRALDLDTTAARLDRVRKQSPGLPDTIDLHHRSVGESQTRGLQHRIGSVHFDTTHLETC